MKFTREQRQEQLRQLRHDLNNHLGVVSTGIQALAGTRDDAEVFAELQSMIEKDGIEPMKAIVDEILEMVLHEDNEEGA